MNVIFTKEIDTKLCADLATVQDSLSNYKNMLNKIFESRCPLPSAETLDGYNEKLNKLQQAYTEVANKCRQHTPKELYFNGYGIKYQWYTSTIYSLFCIECSDFDKLPLETQDWLTNLMTENGFSKVNPQD